MGGALSRARGAGGGRGGAGEGSGAAGGGEGDGRTQFERLQPWESVVSRWSRDAYLAETPEERALPPEERLDRANRRRARALREAEDEIARFEKEKARRVEEACADAVAALERCTRAHYFLVAPLKCGAEQEALDRCRRLARFGAADDEEDERADGELPPPPPPPRSDAADGLVKLFTPPSPPDWILRPLQSAYAYQQELFEGLARSTGLVGEPSGGGTAPAAERERAGSAGK